MIKEQLVSVSISNQGKYYKSLGYTNIKQGDVIQVPWKLLPPNSNKKIECLCDKCGLQFVRQLQLVIKNKNHFCRTCSRIEVGYKNIGNAWGFTSDKSGSNHPRWNPNKPAYAEYKSKVYSVTRKQNLSLLENYEKPRGLCGIDGAYQLDHIISIKQGFAKNIDPEIIGSISNLQFIPWQNNRNKSDK